MSSLSWISSSDDYVRLSQGLSGASRVALDTEFVRTDTFYARLGVVQVGVGGQAHVCDALSDAVMQPLGCELFRGAPPLWILHSCAEDLEVMAAAWGRFPAMIADTQVAAAFVGHPRQTSLQALLLAELGISIPKDETRSDWCQRPLTESQLRYAALDVEHLEALWDVLSDKLARLERQSWCAEDCARMVAKASRPLDVTQGYLQFSDAFQFGDRQLSVLQSLFCWREETARRLDKPRGFLLKDAQLFQVAERLPHSMQALASVNGMLPAQLRRYGADILARVADTPVDDSLVRPPKPLDNEQRKQLKSLKAAIESVAVRVDLPIELLATRRLLEKTLRDYDPGSDIPGDWGEWRLGLLAHAIRESLDPA